TKRVEENLNVEFLENKLIEKGAGPNWLFDIDTLTNSMNYVPMVSARTISTNFSGTNEAASQDVKKDVCSLRYIALPNWFHEAHLETSTSNAQDACKADAPKSSGNSNPTATSTNPPMSPQLSSDTRLISKRVTGQDDTPSLDNILTLSNRFEDILGVTTNTGDSHGVEADLGNIEDNISASPTPTLRIHKDHPTSQIIGPVDTLVKTRTKSKDMEEQTFIASIHHMTNPDLLQFCLFSCFLSQEEPKKISDALKDPRVRPIGTKWVLKNKKDERGIVIRNKARIVSQGHTQEEGIDYEEDPEFPVRVYKVEKEMYGLHQAPKAWYGTLSKYLLTNGFQRGTINQTLFIRKHKGDFILVQVYVDDIIFGSLNPQLCREFEALMHEKIQMSAMGDLNFFFGLQVLQKKDGIFLSQDNYVGDILKKFGYPDVRSANTSMDKENPWGKDGTGKDVDIHLYRSMIGSLMYLIASRPYIMFAVCACARHQVTPKECHLHVVKRIFRYLKGHPKLGVWYPKDSPFDLVAYSDSDYGGATQDRKSTTEVCQFLGRRLISWQCKKQTIVATSTTEAEYVVAASGCGQVLWIQNQMLDYGKLIMARLAFCDYHNMIAILEKYEHNVDFHLIVDFIEASYIRYALTINPTVYVSHIRQFWSTARVETSDEETKILATVDGTPTEPHHTPFPEAPQSPQHDHSSSIHPPVITKTIPTVIPNDTSPLRQYTKRARIAQSLALPTIADEPASPLGDDSQAHDLEITSLKARIKLLEDKDGGVADPSGEDAIIKRRSLEIREEAGIERSTDKGSNDTDEMVNILTSLNAVSILTSGDQVSVPPAAEVATVSIPPAGEIPTVSVPTGSGVVPTASPIFTTATVATPYSRRKGKEKMVESETPKKKKLQEQMDVDAEIARIHAEEELQMLIDSLDRTNETIAKYLQEYEQFSADLSIEERIELINDLVKYQRQLCKSSEVPVLAKTAPLKEATKRVLYESAKKAKTSEEVLEEDLKTMMQLVPVEEVYVEALQVKHPIINWEIHTKGQRSYWKIIRLGGSTTSYQFFVDLLKHFDKEDLNQLWALVKETLNIRQATSDKEKELWVELKRLYEPDVEDQL
nr:hypothetical protein [Tanacetum cinerariifolium]